MTLARSSLCPVLAAALLFSGCVGCEGAPAAAADGGPGPLDGGRADGGDAPEQRTLVIGPAAASAFVGELAGFSAYLVDDEGERENVTGGASWSLAGDPGFSLKAPGVVLVEAAGEAEVVATYDGQRVAASLTGLAIEANVVSLFIEPAELSVPVGVGVPAAAVALYADGQSRDVTSLVAWETLDPAIVSVTTTAEGGALITGEAPGLGKVTAAFASLLAERFVEVSGVPLVDVEIVPLAPAVPEGAALQLHAIGRFADGQLYDLTDVVLWSSSDVQTVSVAAGLLEGVAEGGAEVTARADAEDIEAVALVTVTPPDILALDVTPASIVLAAGASQRVRATAALTGDAVVDVTEEATWSLDGDSALLTGGAGQPLRVRGVFPGSSTLSASYAGRTATVAVIITDASLSSLELVPNEVRLPVGRTQPLLLVGTYTDGSRAEVSGDATWTTDAPDVALVSQAPVARVTALAPGTATVSASLEALEQSATVTVTDAVLVGLQVHPPVVTVPAGDEVRFSAVGVYSDDTQRLMTGEVTWESADEAIAVVSNALGQRGLAEGVSPGTVVVSASHQGLTDTASLRVTDAEVASILVVPPVLVLHPTHQEQARAFASFDNGTTLDVTSQAVWTSSSPTIAAVSNAAGARGRVTGIAMGQAQLDATFGGVTGSATAYVTVQGFSALRIVPNNVFLAPGMSAQLALVGTYQQNQNVQENLTPQAVWTSSNPAVAIVDNFPRGAGRVTARAPGSVTVSASYMGETVQKLLVVSDAEVTALALSPPDANVPVDGIQPFVALATFDDGVTRDVTRDAQFFSEDSTVASFLDAFPGLALALAPGETTLHALFNDVAATTTLTVLDATPAAVVLSPVNPVIDRFQQTRFYATALYDDGSTGDLTYLCSWMSSSPDVLLVLDEPWAKGVAFGFAAGSATVAVDCGGLLDETLVTVR